MSPLVGGAGKFDMLRSESNLAGASSLNARTVIKNKMRGPGFAERSAKIVNKYAYGGVSSNPNLAKHNSKSSGLATRRLRQNGNSIIDSYQRGLI